MTLEEHMRAVEARIAEAAEDSGLEADTFYADIVDGYLYEVHERAMRDEIRRGFGTQVRPFGLDWEERSPRQSRPLDWTDEADIEWLIGARGGEEER